MSSTPQPTPSSSSNHPLTSTEYTLPNPPQHPISSIVFHPDPSSSSQLSRQFLTSSWDSTVRLYQLADVDANNASSSALSGEAKAQAARQVHSFQHEAPVLDVCWITPTLAASGGIDRRVRLLNLEDGSSTILGKHGSAICRMRYEASTNLLISASWDKTLKLWDPTAVEPRLLKTLTLPEKPLAMDVSPPWTASPLVPKEGVRRRLVVAMAARQVRIYDLEDLRRRCDAMSGEDDGEQWDPEQTRESSLKYMVRDVRCNVDGIGFSTSSIEGRIAVDFFDPSSTSQARKYAFKCHRLLVDGIDVVYPVNQMGYHPVHGTFFSLGGDAVLSYWDPVSKKRIRQLPSFPSPLSAAGFSGDGKVLVVASGGVNVEERPSLPNEHGGEEANGEVGGIGKGGEGNVVLWVRENAAAESKPKPPKA